MSNPVVFFEIGCTDQEQTTNFYQQCFDWQVKNLPNSNEVTSGVDDGIHGHITSAVTEIDNYLTFYIQVEDVQLKLSKIEKHGGKTLIPPIKLPNGDTFAWFKDVAGNTVGLITNTK